MFAMFKNFTHSQLLKPIFLSTNHFETQIYNQKLSNFRIDLFYPSVGLISPFAVKQCLLPFTLVLIAQRKISVLVTPVTYQASTTKLRCLRSSAFYRAPQLPMLEVQTVAF